MVRVVIVGMVGLYFDWVLEGVLGFLFVADYVGGFRIFWVGNLFLG